MHRMSLSKALVLFARTAVFLPWRLLFGISSALALLVSIKAGLALERSVLDPEMTGWLGGVSGVVVGIGLWGGAMVILRGLVLAKIKLPHFATMVALIDGEAVPGGWGQVTTAQAIVQTQFGRSNALRRLDRLVRAVVHGAANLVEEGIGESRTGSRLGVLDRLKRVYRRLEVGAISEAVLSHSMRDASENGWDRAHDGLVLFAQNTGKILGVTGRLVLSGWCLSAMVFLVLLEPAAWLDVGISGPAESASLTLGIALVLAWGVKAAVVDPVISAFVLQLFLATIERQKPNAEWRGVLAHSVPAFRKLGEGAETWKPEMVGLPVGQS